MIVTWEIDDGFVCGGRPHQSEIDDDELNKCITEEERQELINEVIQGDFENAVRWFITKID